MPNVIEVTDETFEAEVLQADKPVLVDFTASWCGPCQALAPTLDAISDERDDIKIVKIDVGGNRETREPTNQQAKETYGIQMFPTMYLFRNGNIADVMLGGKTQEDLNNWINETLEKTAADDMDAEQAKQRVADKGQQVQRELEENLKKLAEKIVPPLKMTSAALKIAGAATLALVSPTSAALLLSTAAAVNSGISFGYAKTRKDNPLDNNDSVPMKSLSATFNAATLAAGVMLATATTGSFLLGTAAIMLGGYMALRGAVKTVYDVKAIWDNVSGNNAAAAPEAPEQNAAEANEQAEAEAPDNGCEDGVCEIQPPQQPEQGNNNRPTPGPQ